MNLKANLTALGTEEMCSQGDSYTLMVGMESGNSTVEASLSVSYKVTTLPTHLTQAKVNL